MSRIPAGALAIDASLHLVVDQVLARHADGDLPPSLLHVAPCDDGLDLGFLPLDGAHPTDLLLGATAPPHWHAVGMTTAGWAYPTEDRGRADRRRTRVHLATLLSRSGELAHRVRVDDEELQTCLDDEQPTGEQVDLLRRCLDLPTDPPPHDTGPYWAMEWLARLLAAEPPSTWEEVVGAHPGHSLFAQVRDNSGRERRSDTDVPHELLHAFPTVFGWTRLHRMVVDEHFDVPELAPADAAWLDEGSFARFLLSRCPPLSMLRRQARDELPEHLAHRLETTLGDLGVPPDSWPEHPGG